MTKRHFEVIARAFRTTRPTVPDNVSNVDMFLGAQRQHDFLACILADEFKQFNPRFDHARFLKACGVGDTR